MAHRLGRSNGGLMYHVVDVDGSALCGARLSEVLTVAESFRVRRPFICGECRCERDYRRLADLVARHTAPCPSLSSTEK